MDLYELEAIEQDTTKLISDIKNLLLWLEDQKTDNEILDECQTKIFLADVKKVLENLIGDNIKYELYQRKNKLKGGV
jgi:hypothetical protein